MINTKKAEHNGVTYTKYESTIPVNGAIGYEDKKLVLTGLPAIEIPDGSYKFDKEVQITVYNQAGKVRSENRTTYARQYDRIEIFMSKIEFIEMCRKFIDDNLKNSSILEMRKNFDQYINTNFPTATAEQREVAWIKFCVKKGFDVKPT
jgi:hypothetical protein